MADLKERVMRDSMKFTSLSLTCGLLNLESACFSIRELTSEHDAVKQA